MIKSIESVRKTAWQSKIPWLSEKWQQNTIVGGLLVLECPYWLSSSDDDLLLDNPFLHYWNLIGSTPDMGLTSIPLVSCGGGEVSPFLDMPPPIGSNSFKRSHINNPPNIILDPSLSHHCLHRALNWNHFVPFIDTTGQIRPVLTSLTSFESLPMFMCTIIFITLTVYNHW